MRIQHNISALNTHRNLAFNNTQTSKALEKLSSGYKINRAGDDAAGLAISEKMRGQIRGLDMASKNAQDGISLIQTAEGALNETHSILQRMRELAVQAGNDTNTTGDREEIQKEINQLTSEINRIGNTTEFNTKKLVNGELSDKVVTVEGAAGTPTDMEFAKTQEIKIGATETAWGTSGNQLKSKAEITFTGEASNGLDWSKLNGSSTVEIVKSATGNMEVTVKATDASGRTLDITAKEMVKDQATGDYNFDHEGIKFSLTAKQVEGWSDNGTAAATAKITLPADATTKAIDFGANVVALGTITSGSAAGGSTAPTVSNFKVDGNSSEALAGVKKVELTYAGGNKLTVDLHDAGGSKTSYEYSLASGKELKFNENGISFTYNAGKNIDSVAKFDIELETETKSVEAGKGADTIEDRSVKFQIGANKDQAISVSLEDMRASALGITKTGTDAKFGVTDGTNSEVKEEALDITSHDKAAQAIETIDAAITKVSAERSKLGAVQNRLDHTINNLGTSSENLTAAESRIRDTDMAASMMEFTKNNILTQAAQSMLAQANQQPQGVLQLLG